MKPTKNLSVQELVRYSLLASMTALLQIAPALIPGPGHFLSAFGTLPVALAAYLRPLGGIGCTVVSGWITFVIQPGDAPVLFLCTGPLGLIIGCGLRNSAGPLPVISAGALALTCGILILSFVLGIPVFSPLTSSGGIYVFALFTLIFSFLYSLAWYRFGRTMLKRLARMGLISYAPKRE